MDRVVLIDDGIDVCFMYWCVYNEFYDEYMHSLIQANDMIVFEIIIYVYNLNVWCFMDLILCDSVNESFDIFVGGLIIITLYNFLYRGIECGMEWSAFSVD